MKLNEVPTELLKESLLAIADLRRKYMGEKQVTRYAVRSREGLLYENCPLCLFQLITSGFYPWDRDTVEEMAGECVCPWYWIEERGCEGYTNEQGKEEDYADIPIPDRLKRIDRWEAAINAEIANREAA